MSVSVQLPLFEQAGFASPLSCVGTSTEPKIDCEGTATDDAEASVRRHFVPQFCAGSRTSVPTPSNAVQPFWRNSGGKMPGTE